METIAKIGPSIHIKGEVTSREPLTIAGQVEGTIDVDGHALTVEESGHVTASVTALTIVVAGAVNGRLLASERIAVRKTAQIEGDLTAPAISLADGATVQGRVETAARTPALSLAS
jgi:cytoskeletal protein CcmA (bactofilin family)